MTRRPILQRLFLFASAVSGSLAGLLAVDKLLLNPPPGLISIATFVILATMSALTWLSARVIRRNPSHPCLRFWLAVAMFVVCFVVVDFGCGLLRPPMQGPAMVANMRRHHALVPNQTKTLVERDFSYTIRTNGRGLRGPEVSTPKPEGTTRLLFLGDSFTMGEGVEYEQTFVGRIGAMLQTRTSDRRYDVVDGGIDSYAPVLSRLLLEELLDLQPDHVIHALDMSDLLQEQAYRRIAVRDVRGHIESVPPDILVELDWSRRAVNWLMQHTLMTSMLLQELHDDTPVTVNNFVRRANEELLRHTLEDDDVDRTRQWDDLFDSIGELAAKCRANGIRYSLVIYPWGHQVNATEWPGRSDFMQEGARPSDKVRTIIAERAAALSITLIDTFDDFRSGAGGQRLYWDHDMHWTPAGHQRMAEALLARLPI